MGAIFSGISVKGDVARVPWWQGRERGTGVRIRGGVGQWMDLICFGDWLDEDGGKRGDLRC